MKEDLRPGIGGSRLPTLIRGSVRPGLPLLEDFIWSFSSGHSQPLPQHPPLSPSSGGSEAESRLSSEVQRGWTPLSQRGLPHAVVGALGLGLHTPEVLGENTTPDRTSTGATCHCTYQRQKVPGVPALHERATLVSHSVYSALQCQKRPLITRTQGP